MTLCSAYVQYERSHLCVVQEAIHGVDVGVWPHHHSMWRHSSQITVSVLCDLCFGALRAEQLEVCGVEIYRPWFARVTWTQSAVIRESLIVTERWRSIWALGFSLTICVLENSRMLDESHVSVSLCQTPEWTDKRTRVLCGIHWSK